MKIEIQRVVRLGKVSGFRLLSASVLVVPAELLQASATSFLQQTQPPPCYLSLGCFTQIGRLSLQNICVFKYSDLRPMGHLGRPNEGPIGFIAEKC